MAGNAEIVGCSDSVIRSWRESHWEPGGATAGGQAYPTLPCPCSVFWALQGKDPDTGQYLNGKWSLAVMAGEAPGPPVWWALVLEAKWDLLAHTALPCPNLHSSWSYPRDWTF